MNFVVFPTQTLRKGVSGLENAIRHGMFVLV
jgi:hypothetical protein